MVRHGGKLWAQHPHVANDLTVGERAADRLKAAFGSWTFLIVLNGFIVAWCAANAIGLVKFDPYPFIALNLVLSWLAAQQGGALQIAANRGDRMAAETALHVQGNTDTLLDMNRQQLVILTRLDQLRDELHALATEVRGAAEPPQHGERLLPPLRPVGAADLPGVVVPGLPDQLDTYPERTTPVSNPQGIDVAWPQGAYNWGQQRGRIQFGMCKATEGLSITDPQFVHNWNSMWELNRVMPRFAYHFFHASESPAAQAERFVALVKAHGLLAGDNLVLDLEATEENGSNDNVSPGETAAAAVEFMHQANGLAPGHRVLLYTNPGFAETGACAGLDPWFLWVADYGVAQPMAPAPWKTWTFWQNGDDPIDTDEYNGTTAELLSFCRMPASR